VAGPVQCPKCGANVPNGSRFCQSCGATVAGTAAKSVKRSGAPSQWMILMAGALVVILLGGLAMFGINRAKMAKQHDMAENPAPAGTAAAQTSIEGAGPMPDWLMKADKLVIADYKWAASHHDELQYFPCFCGCDKSAGHASNSSCYFKRDASGQITAYDSHSYG
jgi:uncharacterized integral membrane protein